MKREAEAEGGELSQAQLNISVHIVPQKQAVTMTSASRSPLFSFNFCFCVFVFSPCSNWIVCGKQLFLEHHKVFFGANSMTWSSPVSKPGGKNLLLFVGGTFWEASSASLDYVSTILSSDWLSPEVEASNPYAPRVWATEAFGTQLS